jgi:hypothetical protein
MVSIAHLRNFITDNRYMEMLAKQALSNLNLATNIMVLKKYGAISIL